VAADGASARARIDWQRLIVAALIAPLVLLVAAPLVVFLSAAVAQSTLSKPFGIGSFTSPAGYLVIALLIGVVALVQGYVLTLALSVPTYLALVRLRARRGLALCAAAAIGFLAESAIAVILSLANPRPAPHPLGLTAYVALTFPITLGGAIVSAAFWLIARPREGRIEAPARLGV